MCLCLGWIRKNEIEDEKRSKEQMDMKDENQRIETKKEFAPIMLLMKKIQMIMMDEISNLLVIQSQIQMMTELLT